MAFLTVQLERPEAGFLDLDGEALGHYAEALARSWQVLGVGPGDRVVVYDYGSCPTAYLASRVFTPYLEAGAAELVGCQVICVDGLVDNATRLGQVLAHFKPQMLLARAEAVPLLVSGPTAVDERGRQTTLVVTADGELPAANERYAWEERWPGNLSCLARFDRAAFMAPESPICGHLRVFRDLYEAVAGDAETGDRPEGGAGGPDDWANLTVAPRFMDWGPFDTGIAARPLEPDPCCGTDLRFQVR